MTKIGIIGGSGLDDPKILSDYKITRLTSSFGTPSSEIITGKIGNKEVAILSRHGKKHSIYPTGVNYRANIDILKKLGCTHIIATTAVGSLRANIHPEDFVLPDQFIDFTKHRTLTFHESEVIHTPMAEPFCPHLRETIYQTAKQLKMKVHKTGTVVTIEGPRFSTRAESKMFRLLGADVINMSTVPEVILAREEKICYAVIAMSTDYDCWKENEEAVTWEMIVERMKKNSENVIKLILNVIPKIETEECECCKK